jgi:serine/threonine-protein kinase
MPLQFALDAIPAKMADELSPITGELSAWLRLNSLPLAEHRSSDPKTSSIFSRQFQAETIMAARIKQPYEKLSRKAGALGHTNLIADHDAIVRRIPLIITYRGNGFLSFALQAGRKYFGVALNNVRAGPAGIDMGHVKIPAEGNYQMMLDYSGQRSGIRIFSFADVLKGRISNDQFNNKIVLIGATASGVAARYRTALYTPATAIEITAIAIENIINRKHIARPSWALTSEAVVFVYFTLFLLIFFPRVNPRIGIVMITTFIATWIGLAAMLFIVYGYWLHVTAPIIYTIIGYAVVQSKKKYDQVQKANMELNKTLGLSMQNQGMLDLAFERFKNCPIEEQSVKALLYDLGLDFERKRRLNRALAVYAYIRKAGKYKDIKERIDNLNTLDKTVVLSAGSKSLNAKLLLDDAAAKPTLGRYEILQELGQGAMGTVYLGRDPSINREVAIKTLNFNEVDPDQLLDVKARFFREAEAAGRLSHPNIVTIYDAGEDQDMAFIAMELLRGKDLTGFCQPEKLLPTEQALHVVASVAEALDYAHIQGVVHRDIKPANIILQEDKQVKVADFGIARVMSSSKTKTGIILGTPSYMSPEQVAGKKVDGRSDLFSLGVVFYELLGGKKPFQGENLTALMYAITSGSYVPLAEIAPSTPSCCLQIVKKLMAKGVSKRYKTAADVIEQIQRCKDQLK